LDERIPRFLGVNDEMRWSRDLVLISIVSVTVTIPRVKNDSEGRKEGMISVKAVWYICLLRRVINEVSVSTDNGDGNGTATGARSYSLGRQGGCFVGLLDDTMDFSAICVRD